MAIGDVWTYDLGMGRKEIPLGPGRYLVIAKGHFNQEHAPHSFYATLGFCQLYFGYGPLVRKIDEAVAYHGSLGWANPRDLSSIEGSRGGAVALEAVVEVEPQTGPHAEPGRLVFQAGGVFSGLYAMRMIVMEIAKLRQPIEFQFSVPLADVKGLEEPAAVLKGLGQLVGGTPGKG